MEDLDKYKLELTMLFVAANREYIDMIIRNMEMTDEDSAKIVNMTSLLNRVTSISNTLKKSTKTRTESVITKAYNNGYAKALVDMGEVESIKAGLKSIEYTDTQQSTLDKLISDTYKDLSMATLYMDSSAKKFIRMKTSEAMQLKAAIQSGNMSLVMSLLSNFSEKRLEADAYRQGFTGIVDSAGRRWNLETYAEMVIAAKMQQSYIYGISDISHELNKGLFVISSHNAIDACSMWEGEIITVGDKRDEYYSYEEIAATYECFHPNCKHYITPISESLAELYSPKRNPLSKKFKSKLKK